MWFKSPNGFRIKYLYPLLLAAFPVLALFVNNYGEVGWEVLPRPLLLSLGIAGVALLAFRLLVKDWAKAALMTAWFIILFFSYGHVRDLLLDRVEVLGRHRYLGVIFAGLFGLGYVCIRRLKIISFLNTFLSIVSITGIVSLLIQIIWQERSANSFAHVLSTEQKQTLIIPSAPPDIYYIILDMYSRDDVLKDEFNFDNHYFLQELKTKGFYLAECSRANYSSTAFSLSSSLNLDYLNDEEINTIAPGVDMIWDPAGADGGNDYAQFLISDSVTRQNLEKIGYKTVAIKTNWEWLNIKDADFYIDPTYQSLITNFELLLLRYTYSIVLLDGYNTLWGVPTEPVYTNVNRAVADGIIKLIDVINEVPKIQSPKFVFIHIPVPHPPYYFAINGSDPIMDKNFFPDDPLTITDEYYHKGYINQVEFINNKIPPIIDNILSESISPPIIILQGDHGAYGNASVRMPIFNAIYLPNNSGTLYPSISPVNTFRLIFNDYFGTDYDLLPDRSFYLETNVTPLKLTETYETSGRCR